VPPSLERSSKAPAVDVTDSDVSLRRSLGPVSSAAQRGIGFPRRHIHTNGEAILSEKSQLQLIKNAHDLKTLSLVLSAKQADSANWPLKRQ